MGSKKKAEKWVKCPICKRTVPPQMLTHFRIPLVARGRKLKTPLDARLAECCATVYIDDKELFK